MKNSTGREVCACSASSSCRSKLEAGLDLVAGADGAGKHAAEGIEAQAIRLVIIFHRVHLTMLAAPLLSKILM